MEFYYPIKRVELKKNCMVVLIQVGVETKSDRRSTTKCVYAWFNTNLLPVVKMSHEKLNTSQHHK